MVNEIVVLHSIGAPNHFIALDKYASERGVRLLSKEYAFLWKLKRGIYRRSAKDIKDFFLNIFWYISTLVGLKKNQKILVSIAPFDWRIIFIILIPKNNSLYFHNSWCYWSKESPDNFPYEFKENLIFKFWVKFIKERVKKCFFVTKTAQSSFQNFFKGHPETNVVYHALEDDIFFEKNETKKSIVGYAGRLEVAKGIDTFLEISEKLPKYNFIVAGKGAYENLCIKDSRVEYRGFLDKKGLALFLTECEFLLLPSKNDSKWHESFGIIIIQAINCGAIPIVTNHPGPVEILSDFPELIFKEESFNMGSIELIRNLNMEEKRILRTRLMESVDKFKTDKLKHNWKKIFNE